MSEPAVLAAAERQGKARVSEEAPGNRTHKFCIRSMPEKSAPLGVSEHGSDWGYTEVNLIGGEQQIADLKTQDNLFTVAEMSS